MNDFKSRVGRQQEHRTFLGNDADSPPSSLADLVRELDDKCFHPNERICNATTALAHELAIVLQTIDPRSGVSETANRSKSTFGSALTRLRAVQMSVARRD